MAKPARQIYVKLFAYKANILFFFVFMKKKFGYYWS